MEDAKPLHINATDRGTRAALVFALLAERLTNFYEHDYWMTNAQGATLCADWLSRRKLSLPLPERKQLSELSDQLARQITETLSREAGLYTAHELNEALDQNYHSELGASFMEECTSIVDKHFTA